jgi:uncharacterized repeat protein (TIGR02543 family)
LNAGSTAAFYRAGYVMIGWNTSSSATTALYTNTITTDKNTTLYAIWQLCAAGTYKGSTSNANAACTACASGLTSPAGSDEANDCGRKLHFGSNIIYLRSNKKTTPSMAVKIGTATYYGNMSTATKGKLRITSGGTKYSVYDDSM